MLLPPGLAALTTLVALTLPVVLTQVGFMYMEVSILAATVWAMIAWIEGKTLLAVVWATSATLLKGSGIVVALTLVTMAVVRPTGGRSRLVSLLLILPAPIAATWLQSSLAANGGPASFGPYLYVLVNYLMRVPDVLLLLITFVVATLLAAPWRQPAGDGPLAQQATMLTFLAVAVGCFIAFYGLLPLAGVTYPVLPRYFVQIMPIVIIGLTSLIALRSRRGGVRVARCGVGVFHCQSQR